MEADLRAQVICGFTTMVQTVTALLDGAREVMVVAPGYLIDEMVPPFREPLLQVLGRGGDVRILVLGRPGAEVLELLRRDGIELRSIPERRELGFLLTDRGMMLIPADLSESSPQDEWAILVQDAQLQTHLRLSFQATWRGYSAPWAPVAEPLLPPFLQ